MGERGDAIGGAGGYTPALFLLMEVRHALE